MFTNGELEFQESKNQNKLRPQEIVQTFDDYGEINRYSKVVSLANIAESDDNLNIRRYADTSPPPEIFDVRAILHGGIPVREVESKYIRKEILEDFDVTTVFMKRDEGYFEFKPEVESKEAIREAVGEVDAKVIQQLERWWDKCRVSLHELDVQVAAAESVMKGYLKELGYE